MTATTEVKYSIEIDAWLKEDPSRLGDLFVNGVENHTVGDVSEMLETLSKLGELRSFQGFEWGCLFNWLGSTCLFRFSGELVDRWGNYFPNLDVPVKSGFYKIAWELGEESGVFYDGPDSVDSSDKKELELFTIFLSEVAEVYPYLARTEVDSFEGEKRTYEAVFTTCLAPSHPKLQAIWRSWESYKQNPANWAAAGL